MPRFETGVYSYHYRDLLSNTRVLLNLCDSLYPMIENGLITFDLLWALWKPNTLAFTTTYGSEDEPRVFKVEMAEKLNGFLKGDFYSIEGKAGTSSKSSRCESMANGPGAVLRV